MRNAALGIPFLASKRNTRVSLIGREDLLQGRQVVSKDWPAQKNALIPFFCTLESLC